MSQLSKSSWHPLQTYASSHEQACAHPHHHLCRPCRLLACALAATISVSTQHSCNHDSGPELHQDELISIFLLNSIRKPGLRIS